MRSNYRFINYKNKPIYVIFAHIPGRRFSTGTRDITEAVKFAENKLQEDLKGTGKKASTPTFSEFAWKFFAPEDPLGYRNRNERRNHNYDDAYYSSHQARLENYILPMFGPLLITAITDVAIEDWLIDLRSYRHNENQLSDSSKNKVLDCFRIVLHEAKRLRYISNNPAKEVRQINAIKKRREPFTDIELAKMFPKSENKLLRIWGSRMWATYFLIMRDTGFRPGEVAGLKPSCYNEPLHGIYTEESIHWKTHEVINRIKTTGKGQEYKIGILTNQTIDQLNKHLEKSKIKYDQLMFMLEERTIRPESANKHLKASLERAEVEVKERTQYSLRHSFETDLAGRVENALLKELMAHTGYRQEYDHRDPETLMRQLQPVRDILEKRGKIS